MRLLMLGTSLAAFRQVSPYILGEEVGCYCDMMKCEYLWRIKKINKNKQNQTKPVIQITYRLNSDMRYDEP